MTPHSKNNIALAVKLQKQLRTFSLKELEEFLSNCELASSALQSRKKLTNGELRKIFNAYNMMFSAYETGLHCGPCRKKVGRHCAFALEFVKKEINER